MSAIPFKAALFDLDGTLLDSMYVWKHVDEVFFASRGLPLPETYAKAIAGMSYLEGAEYTVAHYLPGERPEALVAEWTRLAQIEYAERVPLKPGARQYLRMLKREGVKLAVVTAMPPNLFEPCLMRLGVIDLFDALCSVDHVGGRGKGDGALFLHAAKQLGVEPGDCAVFEDVLTGIQGAKVAGMRAYCVRDSHSAHDFAKMEALADGCVDALDEMSRFHAFPESRRCVVFSARCDGDLHAAYAPKAGDYVLCADGGWKLAQSIGVEPALVLGDFDSSEAPKQGVVERHPVMKDDTDTLLCLRRGLKLGYDDFLIVGGFGGRLDHTLANLQSMRYVAELGAKIAMDDGVCRAAVLCGGEARFDRRPGKLSVFSLSDRCDGVCIRGALYELEDATLSGTFPIGVSNEYAADAVVVSVREGALLVVQSGMD